MHVLGITRDALHGAIGVHYRPTRGYRFQVLHGATPPLSTLPRTHPSPDLDQVATVDFQVDHEARCWQSKGNRAQPRFRLAPKRLQVESDMKHWRAWRKVCGRREIRPLRVHNGTLALAAIICEAVDFPQQRDWTVVDARRQVLQSHPRVSLCTYLQRGRRLMLPIARGSPHHHHANDDARACRPLSPQLWRQHGDEQRTAGPPHSHRRQSQGLNVAFQRQLSTAARRTKYDVKHF